MSLETPTRRQRLRERIAAEVLGALVSTTKWSPSSSMKCPRQYAAMARQFTDALIEELYP